MAFADVDESTPIISPSIKPHYSPHRTTTHPLTSSILWESEGSPKHLWWWWYGGVGYLSVKQASFSPPPKSTGSKIGTMSLGSRGGDHCSCFLDIKVHLKANMHGASCQTMSQRGEAASGSGHDGALAATVLAGLERVLLHRLVSFLWYCTPNSGSPLRIFF